MIARVLDELAAKIRDRRRRALECALLGAAVGGLAGAAMLVSPRLAVALGAGAAVQVVLALGALVSRQGLIARLALEPDAYAIPEVKRYGLKLTRPRQRALLAEGIMSMVRNAFSPGALYLGDRVARYRRELEAIARDLLSPAVRVHPVSAVRCRRLLTEAAESPLYNPRLTEEDLTVILRRIRAGMEREE